jgi:RimJ/RimL family protein N-acetyltransferase
MLCHRCTFETDRLRVQEWRSTVPDHGREEALADTVAAILTERVTQGLPTAWRGKYTVERAASWIEERDREGTTLLAVDNETNRPIGLMILFEVPSERATDGVEVRIGYLLAETAWGRGFASELVSGFVEWCRNQASILSLAGGVERDNVASIRVLEKNGFHPVQDEDARGEQMYRLDLRQ